MKADSTPLNGTSLNSTPLNGASRWVNMSLRELRTAAASHGISVDEHGKYDLIEKLEGKLREDQDKQEDLQKECARRGLSTEGSLLDLKLRLEQHKDNAVSFTHRRVYFIASCISIVLGCAALGVSLPHVAAELQNIMGVHWIYAGLLALIIDGGVVSMKIVDTLAHKFELNKIRPSVWVLMIACLIFSAALNASQFIRHVEPTLWMQCLAIGTAIFVSSFVFCMFYIGSWMMVKCEDRRNDEESLSPADLLRAKAAELDRLSKVATRF